MSECFIDSADGMDSPKPDLFSVKTQKSQKEYKCCECWRVIKKDTKYERIKGIWEGEWETYKTCDDCVQIRSLFCSYRIGAIWEDLHIEISESETDDLFNCALMLDISTETMIKLTDYLISDYELDHLDDDYIDSKLSKLDKEMKDYPERVVSLDSNFMSEIRELVKDVK